MSAPHRLARVERAGLVAVGAALVAYAVISPRLRGADGFLAGTASLPIAAGIAALLAGAAATGALRYAARWLAVALVGGAAALQLVVAGVTLHYAHYLPWSGIVAERPVAAAIIALQALAVGWAMRTRWRAVAKWIRRELGAWRGALLLAALVLSSATLSRDIRAYGEELITASVIQLLNLATVFLVVWSVPPDSLAGARRAFDRLLGAPNDAGAPQPGGADRFAYVCAAGVTLVAALLSVVIYERHPHVQDEVKYLFQARYFATGALSLPVPPVPKAFELYLLDIGPLGWYCVDPPGWPAMLAIGAWLGVPWLVNPVLSGVNVLLAYVLLRSMYDLRTTRLATLLLVVSPWYLFLGMSFMAHAGTLFCALLGALGVERARRTGEARWAWLGGLAVGAASLIRQLDGLVMALLLGLWAIGLGGKRLRIPAIAGLVLGTMLTGAIVLPYNKLFTGKATSFPIMAYNDRLFGVNSNAYGFGPDRGMGWELDPNPGHGPVDATINANLNTTAMNVELFGWSVGSLLLIYALVLRGRLRRSDRAMLAVIAAVFGAYFFNYFSGGPDFGARYWFLMIVPLAALAARGAEVLGARLRQPSEPAGLGPARALTAIAALCAGTVVAFFPWRALDKYHHYLDMRPDLRVLAREGHFGRSLVLVRGVEFPDFASAAAYNPLDLHASAPVFAHDRDPETRRDLLHAYIDRPVWIVEGPTLTKGGYRIVSGPIPASRLLATDREGGSP